MNIDSMIQGNPQALVTSYNGVLVADSLEVADRFGKAHKNVVRDIENLMDGIEANLGIYKDVGVANEHATDFRNLGPDGYLTKYGKWGTV